MVSASYTFRHIDKNHSWMGRTWVGHVESFDICIFIPKQNKQNILNENGFWEVTFMIEKLLKVYQPASFVHSRGRV